MRKVVVLPAPVGPKSTVNAPSAISSERSSIAVTVLKRLVTLRNEMSAMMDPLIQRRAQGAAGVLVEERQAVAKEGEAHLLTGIDHNTCGYLYLDADLKRLHCHDLHRAQIFGAENLAATGRPIIEADM